MKKFFIVFLVAITVLLIGGCSSQKGNVPSASPAASPAATKENSSFNNTSANQTNNSQNAEVETRLKYIKLSLEDEVNNPNAKKKYEKVLKLEEEYKSGEKSAEEVIKELDIIKNSN